MVSGQNRAGIGMFPFAGGRVLLSAYAENRFGIHYR